VTASLPPQIGSLQRLETLMVEHNRITALPPTIEGLKSLRHISLAHNELKAFPVQLCAIRTLDVIDLSNNKLTDVPDAVRDLNAIELNVNQNQVIFCFFIAVLFVTRLNVIKVGQWTYQFEISHS